MEPRFAVGDQVQVIGQPGRVGMVQGRHPYGTSWTYQVFFSWTEQVAINESALEAYVPTGEALIASRDEFLRALLLTKLENKLNDTFYAYQGSRTQFEAYQFKPILRLLDSPVPALLIADEVGLGKTIEAAIILEELKARGTIERIMVVCPAGLRDKWRAELLTRFDEDFRILRREGLMEDARQYQLTDGRMPLQGIVSLESFRNEQVQEAIADAGVTYDLVIIDEAHHLRTTGTLSHAVGEQMRAMSEYLILLTATPLQTGQQDLFNLVRFLDPQQFTQFGDFELQLKPNARLNAAIRALRQPQPVFQEARAELDAIASLEAARQVTDNPTYGLVLEALARSHGDREALVRLMRDIDSLNVLSSVYTRTTKASVTRTAKRTAHVLVVEPTNQEIEFLEAVLEHARAEVQARSGSRAPGFAGMMRERQAASSITAMREYLRATIEAGSAGVRLGAEASGADVESEVTTPSVASSIQALAAAAERLGPTDSKFERFWGALRGILEENTTSKVIVFTTFRRTIAYLERELRRRGVIPLVIHGDVKPEDRTRLIGAFEESPDQRVLLTTEVGSEGLDFQFCDALINYDLPWNPMRVEQRIGRIDRYGQKAERVRIYSLFMGGTIEERILERLYLRIGIFEDSVGDLEPILGPISADLTKEVFASELSADEEIEMGERFARMVLGRREEERSLAARGAELLGQDTLISDMVDDTVQSGRYVSPDELRAMVAGFLDATGGGQLTDLARDGSVLLRPQGDLQSRLRRWMQEQRDNRPTTVAFAGRLESKGGVPGTFIGDLAQQRSRLELFNLRHPLVRMAVDHHRRTAQRGSLPVACLTVDPGDLPDDLRQVVPVGTYQFALFLLEVTGAIRQLRLLPVAFDADGRRAEGLEGRVLHVIQSLATAEAGGAMTIADRDRLKDAATRVASAIADQVEAEAAHRNDASIAVRRATLDRTFRLRIQKRRDLLATAKDERIRRLRSGEITNLERDLKDRVRELEANRSVAVQRTLVGVGRIHVAARAIEEAEPEMEAAPETVHADAPASPYPSFPDPDVVYRP